MFVSGNEKACGATSGIKNRVGLLRVNDTDDEVDDVPRRTKLSGIALAAENRKQVFKRVAEPFAVIVCEAG